MSRVAPTAPDFQRAIDLQRAGRRAEADALCVSVLRAEPRHFGALHLRGLLALDRGDTQAGIEFILRSLAVNPHQPAAHSNIGNALLGRQQLQDALVSFDHALRLDPNHVAAWYNRANALRELGRPLDAAASYERALALKPDHRNALNNYGAVLRSLQRYADALQAFERALALDSHFVPAQQNRAAVLLELKRPHEALACYDSLLASDPLNMDALRGRGTVQLHLGEFVAARESFTGVLRQMPGDVDALINRGNALRSLGLLPEALDDYRRALDIAPASALALGNCGNVLADLGRYEAALESYDAALALAPEDPEVLFNRGAALNHLWHLRMEQCDWTDYEQLLAANHAALERNQVVYNPMSLLLLDDPALALACTRSQVRENFPATATATARPHAAGVLATGAPASTPAATGRKLRLAYLSADFNDHPVSQLLVGVLERHDRTRCELFGISFTAAAQPSSFTRRVMRAFDHYLDVAGRSDAEIAALLRDLGIDIAVDLMGLTLGFRLGVFAQRAAPVQVSYLGYAATSGAPYIDYLLADATVVPDGDERFYEEKIVRLPHCVLPTDDRREVASQPSRREAGLPESGFVFCAFTQPYKITPPVFSIWMQLLADIDASVLWLRQVGAPAQANLTREAARHGVAPERLVFAPYLPSMAEHLARHGLADVYLDTLPCNAHSTVCDALFAGVPAITCLGRGFASRVAASALQAAGLSDLVTGDLAAYRALALRLARRSDELTAVRARLAQARRTAALFDTGRYTRALEAAFAMMHERSLTGAAPVSFAVSEL